MSATPRYNPISSVRKDFSLHIFGHLFIFYSHQPIYKLSVDIYFKKKVRRESEKNVVCNWKK